MFAEIVNKECSLRSVTAQARQVFNDDRFDLARFDHLVDFFDALTVEVHTADITATYTLSPYEMVYTNEHYYLICVPDHDPHTRLYRIDRMADIRILDEPRSEKSAQKQEAQDAVYAFVGAPERVVLHCDRAVLDDVLDRFGTDIQIFERDEQTFTAVLTTPPRGVRFWALQYLSFVEVAEPAWLRQEIIEALKGNHYLT